MITINNTVPGVIQNIEVKGNTYQDPNNLSKIVSAGIDNGDGTYKMSILSVGENLFSSKFEVGGISWGEGTNNDNEKDRVRSGFIRIKPNTRYITSEKNNLNPSYTHVFYYDNSKKFIKYTQGSNIEVLNNCYYLRFLRMQNGTSIDIFLKLQEGTVATPYTPYQETRCDIKLPCQLERWDKLYFDKVENAWVVDKWTLKYSPRNQHYTIASLENVYRCFPASPTLECAEYKNDYGKATTICKGLPFIQDNYFARDEEHYYIDPNAKREYLFFNKNKFDGTSDGLNKYFESIDFYMLVKLASPQKIVLPQSEQIKLNSFANKTHIYTISGEVDATVKATVSKSLASTVQANTEEINKINNTIADMQGLKESQDFAYETDRGYLVCKDTQSGVVKDLKIFGKSIVQVYPQLPLNDQNYAYNVGLNGVIKEGDYVTVTGNGTHYIDAQVRFSKNELFKPSTEYTFFIEVVSNSMKGKFDFNVDYLNRSMVATTSAFGIEEGFIGTKIIKAITKDATWFNDNTIENKVILRTQASILNTGSIKYRIWAIEGSHYEIVPFFKGIASVGNGNGIEALSRNKNIAKEIVAGTINTTTGEYMDNSNVNRLNKVRILPNTKYTFSKNNTPRACNKYFYDKDNKFIGTINGVDSTFITPTNAYYISLTWGTTIEDGNYQLELGSIATTYEKPKEDKKPILFKDTDGAWKPVTELRGIDVNSCDILDSTVNKLYRKYINVLLNGSEDISTYGELTTNTIGFKINSITNFKPLGLMISDKLRYLTPQENIFASDIEGISMTQTSFVIRISKSKLETQDVTGFKKWLQSNPVTVIYQLAQEKIYEVNPLDLESFENETMILFGSGAIAPHAEWKIASHAANIIKNQGQRITRLENDFYKYTVVQNRIMLDSRYAADSATFKVDTSIYNSNNATASSLSASICAAKETRQDVKYDLDLYKLIKRNILVGKDNYDRVWMEECITFYWMDFKISDDMHSELNEIIENQYNPPIDMTPIEPPMEDVGERDTSNLIVHMTTITEG